MTRFRQLVRFGLPLSVGFAVAASIAQAQDAATPQTAAEDEDELLLPEVTVTGSRVRRDNFNAPSPIQIVTAERSALAGMQATAQILQESTVAASSGQINTLFGGYITDGGPGAQTLSLRGLGAQRTLVLLNGRRLPPAGVGGTVGPVDLNVIPNSIVNRIELLKDGASSIYGSDAVAGVANVITRTRVTGGRIGGQHNSASGGGDETSVEGSYGWAWDRGGVSVSAEWYKLSKLKLGDRPQAACGEDLYYAERPDTVGAIPRYGIPGRAVQVGDRSDLINPQTGQYMCWAPFSTGWTDIYSPGWDPLGTVTPLPPGRGYVPATGDPDVAEPVAGLRRYASYEVNAATPEQLNSDLIPYQERTSVFAQGEYNFGPGGEIYGEALFSRRESKQDGMRQLYPWVALDSEINPYPYYFWPTALFPTGGEQDVRVGRLLTGLRGDVGSRWRYDAYVSHSRSDGDYADRVVPYDRIVAATGTLQDQEDDPFMVGELNPDGVCGPSAPAGCVPFSSYLTANGMRYGIYTPEEMAYLNVLDKGNTKYDQTIFEAQITGDLMQLPAGPLGAAFGVQYRRDKINDVPGEYSRDANAWGQSTAGITRGSDNVKEVFAEFELPLVRNLPAVQDLSLNVSGRYSDYKTVGDATTYKLGLNWKINDLLRARSTYGTSFRSPALYELYLNDQTGFQSQNAVDPCVNYADPSRNVPQVIQDNCAAAGIPGNYTTQNLGSATILTGGGLGRLKPEKSDALTIGAVITPPGTGFSFAVDYWDIDVRDQVDTPPGLGILTQCYGDANYNPNEGFCTLFSRVGSGPNPYVVDFIDASYLNIPSRRTKGFDGNIGYERSLSFGKLEFDGEVTHTTYDKSEYFPGEITDYTGTVGDPDWTANAQLRLKRGDWTFAWSTQFIGGEDNLGWDGEDGIINGGALSGWSTQITGVKDIFTHDVSVRYRGLRYEVIVGATNITDEQPPRMSDGVAGIARLGTIPLTSQYYGLIQGRTGFVSLSRKF